MKRRATHVTCKSCDGTGMVTYPSALVSGVWRELQAGTCLGCGGHGYFVRSGGVGELTYAGPMKEGETR